MKYEQDLKLRQVRNKENLSLKDAQT